MSIRVILVFMFIFSGFSIEWAHGGCGDKDPSTGLMHKCWTAAALANVGPDLEQTYINELGQIFNNDPLQIERICRNPIKVIEHVRPSGSPDGRVRPRICSFSADLECVYKGRRVNTTIKGSCYGGLHDCGTLKECILGQSPNENFSGFQTKEASFRAENAPAPKNFQFAPPPGVSQ